MNDIRTTDNKRPLVFITSLVPTDDPTSGGGVMHREWAKAFQRGGVDVVLIEANNKKNAWPGDYPVRSILFNGQENNPWLSDVNRDFYKEVTPSVPHNYPVFTQLPTSSQQFYSLSNSQLDAYIMQWLWAFRSAALVYGVPDAAWNGHAWIQNAVTSSVPTIFTVHGTGIADNKGYREERLRKLVQLGVDNAEYGVAISSQELMNIRDENRYGMSAEKSSVVWNGYNNEVFTSSIDVSKRELVQSYPKLSAVDVDADWVVFAGKAAHFKGIDNLLYAFQNVLEDSDAHLIILGGGDHKKVENPEGGYLNHYDIIDELELGNRVHILGPVPQPEMAKFIRISDAYVLPSRNEPFGLVAIEGMGTGKSPILTNGGGFVDIVSRAPDEAARMVRAEDVSSPDVIELAMKLISKNDSLKKSVGEVARGLLQAELKSDTTPPVDGIKAADLKAGRELVDRMKVYASREIAIRSLGDGIKDELNLSPKERGRRGKIAHEFAEKNFSIGSVVAEDMMPVLKGAMEKQGNKAAFELEPTSDSRSNERMERVEGVRLDASLASAYNYLKNSLGTDQVGKAWRSFDAAVSKFFGETEFMRPLDLNAMPAFQSKPNDIIMEVAKASGVALNDMFATIKVISQTSANLLVAPRCVKAPEIEMKRNVAK